MPISNTTILALGTTKQALFNEEPIDSEHKSFLNDF